MMPLWLDMLRTPMAAPETIRLRVMRLAWLSLCVALAGSVILLEPLQDHLGKAAPCMIALLLGAALTLTIVYLRLKQRPDPAYIEHFGAPECCAPFARSSVRCPSQSARLRSRRAPRRPGQHTTSNSEIQTPQYAAP